MRIVLPKRICDDMVAHAKAESPRECCGFIYGKIEDGVGQASHIRSLVNNSERDGDFLTDPRDVFLAERVIYKEGFEKLAVYHSHPMSAAVPSRGDLRLPAGIVNVIVSLRGSEPDIRGWWIEGGGAIPAELVMVGD